MHTSSWHLEDTNRAACWHVAFVSCGFWVHGEYPVQWAEFFLSVKRLRELEDVNPAYIHKVVSSKRAKFEFSVNYPFKLMCNVVSKCEDFSVGWHHTFIVCCRAVCWKPWVNSTGVLTYIIEFILILLKFTHLKLKLFFPLDKPWKPGSTFAFWRRYLSTSTEERIEPWANCVVTLTATIWTRSRQSKTMTSRAPLPMMCGWANRWRSTSSALIL